MHKILTFRGALNFLGPKMALGWRLVPFNGPKKSWAPRKGSIFCRTHLETYNRPHLVILGGRFYKTPHGFQHRSLGNLMLPVLTIFVGFFSIFGLFDTPPPTFLISALYCISGYFLKRMWGGGELALCSTSGFHFRKGPITGQNFQAS